MVKVTGCRSCLCPATFAARRQFHTRRLRDRLFQRRLCVSNGALADPSTKTKTLALPLLTADAARAQLRVMIEERLNTSAQELQRMARAFTAARDEASMDQLHALITKRSLPVDCRVYLRMVQMRIAVNDSAGALKLLRSMHNMNVEPDAVLYSVLIAHFTRRGYAKLAIKIFRQCQRRGVRNHLSVLNAALAAYVRLDDMRGVRRVYMQLRRAKLVPSAVTYTLLLHAAGNSDSVAAVENIWREVAATGVSIDERLRAAFVRSRARARQLALTRTSVDTPTPTDAAPHSSPVDGQSVLPASLLDAAEAAPGVLSWNAAMETHARAGDAVALGGVYQKMLHNKVEPNIDTFHLLLRLNDDKAVLRHMEKHNIAPTARTYAIAISHLQRRGGDRETLKRVGELLRLMHAQNIRHDHATRTALAGVLANVGLYDRAERLLRDVNDRIAFHTLLRVYCARDDAPRALGVYQRMLQGRVSPNTQTMNFLLAMHARQSDVRAAELAFADMQQRRLVPDIHTLKHMTRARASAGEVRGVRQVLRLARLHDLPREKLIELARPILRDANVSDVDLDPLETQDADPAATETAAVMPSKRRAFNERARRREARV